MHEDEKPAIRRLPLFQQAAEQTFDSLMRIASVHNVPPRRHLIRRGTRPAVLHVLMEGAVELHAGWNGNEAVMAVLRPVSCFILAACVTDLPHLMAARTLEQARIITIPAGDLRGAMRQDAGLAMAAMTELAGSYRSMVRQSMNLKLRNSRERLAAWLLRQSQGLGEMPSFVLPVEKRHLASYLGMTPESLSRTLRQLQDSGVVVEGARVTITDRDGLMALARPDPLMDAGHMDEDSCESRLPGHIPA